MQRSLAQNSTAQKSSSKHSLIKNEECMTPRENGERIASKMMMHLFLILVRPGCFLFTHVKTLPLSGAGIPLFVFFFNPKNLIINISYSIQPDGREPLFHRWSRIETCIFTRPCLLKRQSLLTRSCTKCKISHASASVWRVTTYKLE